jgi:hypothetical protein
MNFNELFVQSERTSLELKIESLQSKLNAPIGLLTTLFDSHLCLMLIAIAAAATLFISLPYFIEHA